jgi:hypothetical protein
VYSDEQVARVCHAAAREMQSIHNDPMPSQPWDCEPAELRESVIEGVRSVRSGITPREHHQNWVTFKREHGWVYGPEKDPEAKTHPCLVPYDELPAAERDKDQLFLLIVTALTLNLLPELSVRRYQDHGDYRSDLT